MLTKKNVSSILHVASDVQRIRDSHRPNRVQGTDPGIDLQFFVEEVIWYGNSAIFTIDEAVQRQEVAATLAIHPIPHVPEIEPSKVRRVVWQHIWWIEVKDITRPRPHISVVTHTELHVVDCQQAVPVLQQRMYFICWRTLPFVMKANRPGTRQFS